MRVVQDCHFNPTCAFASSTESAALLVLLVTPEMKDCLSNCGESVGDLGVSEPSKLTSNSVTLGFFFSDVRGGSLGPLPTGWAASIWYHGGERTCSDLGAA